MAGQTTKYVNLQRSYVPADPNSFPDGLHVADMREEERFPVMPYDGYNFMPTAYGYRSYFGLTQRLDIDELGERCDFLFLYQTPTLENYLIALCDTGIWIKYGAEQGAWEQEIQLDGLDDGDGTHYEWTYTVIENYLYVYRQNGDHYWRLEFDADNNSWAFEEYTPSFLNMEAQQGIFRAGERLGFWDSSNSISWSSVDDSADFTPDLETLAGNSVFPQIMGQIVNILPQGDGFVIYCTKSIVRVTRQYESLFLWQSSRILQDTGIAYRRDVVASSPDLIHYAYTTTGIYEISENAAQVIIPGVFDHLQQTETPKYLRILGSRYLFLQIMDFDFQTGEAAYTEGVIPETTITLPTTDLNALVQGMNDGDYPDLTVCDLLHGMEQGWFLDINRDYDQGRPEDHGVGGGGGGGGGDGWMAVLEMPSSTSYPYLRFEVAGIGEQGRVSCGPGCTYLTTAIPEQGGAEVAVSAHINTENDDMATLTVYRNGIQVHQEQKAGYAWFYAVLGS